MSFWDWSNSSDTTNATASGVDMSEGCAAANMNNGTRRMMTQIRAAFDSAMSAFFGGSAPLPIANGGTAAITAAAARTALGAAGSGANTDILSLAGLTTPLSVAQGGTGVASLAALLAALAFTAGGNAAKGHFDIVTTIGTLRLNWGNTTVGGNATTTDSLHANVTTAIGAFGGVNGNGTSDGDNVYIYSSSTSSVSLTNGVSSSLSFFWLHLGIA